MDRPRSPASSETDAQLVARARGGDLDSFSELVRRHQRPLMAKALASTRNVADADDLVQETFMRAWRGLDDLREEERFGGWLHRVLGNLLVDRSRRAWREVSEGEHGLADVASARPDPEAGLLSRELARGLRRALDALPPGRQRDVFRMRYVDGLQIAEIAASLGVHTGTVQVHLFRTSRKLRDLLAGLETA